MPGREAEEWWGSTEGKLLVRFRKQLRPFWRRGASADALGQREKQTRDSRCAAGQELLASWDPAPRDRTAPLSTLGGDNDFLGSICHELL